MTPLRENGDDAQTSTPEYRDRLRTWLIKMIDSGTIPGLQWENVEKTIFRMPWKHAGRQDYSVEEDSRIFMAWAIHSGRHREGIDKPEPIIWKTRLRCALNKMPDIREIPDRSRLDISEPYRVYRVLPPVHKESQIKRRLQRRYSNAQTTEPLTKSSQSEDDLQQGTAGRQATFRDHPLQKGRESENSLGAKKSDFGQAAQWDVRNPVPWFGSLPRAENRFLPGFNLNSYGYGTPANVRGFVRPYGLFASVPPKYPRQRSEFDSSLFSYQSPVLDHAYPFLIPGPSIGGVSSRTSIAGLSAGADVASAVFGVNLPPSKNTLESADESRKISNHGLTGETQEAKYKIETLELEIARWKKIYQKERAAREEIERRHERLEQALENVRGNVITMMSHVSPLRDNKDSSVSERGKNVLGDSHVTAPPFVGALTSRSERLSAGERKRVDVSGEENDRSSPRSIKRRYAEDDDTTEALDLTSPSLEKRIRCASNSSCADIVAFDLRLRGSPKSGTPKESERSFRYSSSTDVTNLDCDEASTANAQPPATSPSASSNCSSGEEPLSSAGMSPVVPMCFRNRADGRIQVT